MEAMLPALKKLVMIMILIGIGLTAKKKGLVTQTTQNGMMKLFLNLILPLSIFTSFTTPIDSKQLNTSLILLVIAFIFYPLMEYVISNMLFYFVKDKETKAINRMGATYANTIFMGYPFVEAMYGAQGILYASVFNIPFNLFNWSIGAIHFSNQKLNLKTLINILKNPIIIACFIGYTYWLTSAYIPKDAYIVMDPFFDAAKSIGSMSVPMSILLIGMMLSAIKMKPLLKDIQVWYFSFIKLIVVPALLYGCLRLLNLEGMMLGVPVILVAMPMGATCGMIAAKYHIKEEMAASLITMSTLLSMITLPLWMIILSF